MVDLVSAAQYLCPDLPAGELASLDSFQTRLRQVRTAWSNRWL